jgi:hypothetical protein
MDSLEAESTQLPAGSLFASIEQQQQEEECASRRLFHQGASWDSYDDEVLLHSSVVPSFRWSRFKLGDEMN